MNDAAPTIAGKVYVVTGASRGVGLAIARALHKRGARVAMLARAADELAGHAADLGERALALGCDVARRDEVDAAIARTVAAFGGIDGVVNNAGVARIGPIETLSVADMQLMFDVNIIGTLNVTQAAIPHLRAGGGGNILNIGSASVSDPTEFPFLGGYAAVKAALERMTEELRIENSKDNIAVTLFRLGSTLTYFGTGWDLEVTERAFAEWHARGGLAPATMPPEHPAEAVVRCLESPPGACADFITFRPFGTMPKQRAMAG